MKAPVSISVASSLFLTLLASLGTASGETNSLVRAKPDPNLSRATAQILQLTQAGMDETVITSFISNSGSFQLSADHIVYLNDLGVSSRVIQAMLEHDREKLVASSQNTNASNVSLALQQETASATSVEQAVSQSLALANAQAQAKSQQVVVVGASSAKTENLVKEDPVVAQKLTSRQTVPKKKVFYPVRAPYPVELTAPIVFLDAPTY